MTKTWWMLLVPGILALVARVCFVQAVGVT